MIRLRQNAKPENLYYLHHYQLPRQHATACARRKRKSGVPKLNSERSTERLPAERDPHAPTLCTYLCAGRRRSKGFFGVARHVLIKIKRRVLAFQGNSICCWKGWGQDPHKKETLTRPRSHRRRS